MYKYPLTVAFAALALCNIAVASAQSPAPAVSAASNQAHCAAGDPNVLVDRMKKTYVIESASVKKNPPNGSLEPSNVTGDMAGQGGPLHPGKSAPLSMCKSKADGQGMHQAGSK